MALIRKGNEKFRSARRIPPSGKRPLIRKDKEKRFRSAWKIPPNENRLKIKGPRNLLESYRPISFLHGINKLIQKIMYDQIYLASCHSTSHQSRSGQN